MRDKSKSPKKKIGEFPCVIDSRREDHVHCPNCDHRMDYEEWDKAAVMLVLHPLCWKHGAVAVVSECPKCFDKSWTHESMDNFSSYSDWPENWCEAVQKLAANERLKALREWGASICHTCKHLESGKIDYVAWRHCIIGSGGPEKKCLKYEPV